MATKYDFITIAPVTSKGKWTICQRRIGSRDRYAPVAETRTQTAADGIVDAMNLMQGEVKKLEVPAQRLLEQVRGDLKIQQDKTRAVEAERSGLSQRLREAQTLADNRAHERNLAQARVQTLEARVKDLEERNEVQSNTIAAQIEEIRSLNVRLGNLKQTYEELTDKKETA